MSLSETQSRAVAHGAGPCICLAGPGSGKTTVITERTKYLIEKQGISPSEILVITFTKAASIEMRERFHNAMKGRYAPVTFGTFHAVFFTILKAAYHYTAENILREEEKYTILRDILEPMDLEIEDEKEFLLGVTEEISLIKNERISLEHYYSSNCPEDVFRSIFREYQQALIRKRKLDFDDMLVCTYELLKARPDICRGWQKRFRYILIDEFQDINAIQYETVKLLAQPGNNLFIVGDDDQSIYRFRGANIGNILGFEKVFPEAKVVRLEQNYRSTQNILNAANEVIVNNTERKEKRLWTENEEGDKVHFRQFNNGFEEAEYVAGEIIQGRRNGKFQYKDCAVLYRTNAQSRLFEEKFLLANVPYKIVGGVNFYARKEIKDLLSYLKTIDNASDDLAVRRILNVPKRGIGFTSIGRVQDYADMMNLSFYDALRVVEEVPSIGRAAGKINDFVSFIQGLKSKAEAYTVRETLEEVIELTGYVKELEAEKTEEAQARIENIDELISKTESFQEAMEEAGQPATLSAFLEEIALVADIDSVDPDQDYVLLMTLHSAKGLEFPNVFIVGMEDGVFPGYASIWSGDPSDIEEERRLCYVGITRAMKELTLTCAKQRMIRGETQYNRVSRFVREVPRELVDLGHTIQEKKPKVDDIVSPKSAYAQMKMNFQAKSTLQKKDFTVKKADSLDYGEGDTVRHVKFGVGIVKNIADGGRDYEVTVDFDKVGVKKMFAGFAKLKKI